MRGWRLRSIQGQLVLVAVTTTFGTTVLLTLLVTLFIAVQPSYDRYAGAMLDVVIGWSERADPASLNPDVQGYVVGPDLRIRYVYNDPGCMVGAPLVACADLASIPEDGHMVERMDGAWYESRKLLPDGNLVLARARRQSAFSELMNGLGVSMLVLVPMALVALPIALLLSLLVGRTIIRRLGRITQASRAFAAGDLVARSGEQGYDEIGQLGQHFDNMATRISRQMVELRDLAAENSRLIGSAEQSGRVTARAQLARDLHDTVAQHLFSLAMGSASLGEQMRRNPALAAQQAEQLATIAAQAQDELRTMLLELRPRALEQKRLPEALSDLAHEWQQRIGISAEIRLSPGVLPIPLVVEDVFYRVCQESLNNVARHAEAQHVTIHLADDGMHIRLSISDDGRGFDPVATSGGFGLLGMRERVRAIGGVLQVQSTPGAGTWVEASVAVVRAEEMGYANQLASGR